MTECVLDIEQNIILNDLQFFIMCSKRENDYIKTPVLLIKNTNKQYIGITNITGFIKTNNIDITAKSIIESYLLQCL